MAMTDERQIIEINSGEVIDAATAAMMPADLKLLDTYGDSPIADEDARVEALATISAGYREPGKDGHVGRPVVSRDGTIYVSEAKGQPAPGIREELAKRDNKSLLIAFPYNNPAFFVQERFVEYSSTHLLAWGDENEITVIGKNRAGESEQRTYERGTPEYEAARKRCKVSTSFYFSLMRWEGSNCRFIFPDGVGLYRGRTGGRNSLRSLRASLALITKFTHGQIAGIPLELSLKYPDVAGPDGSRRNVPVWTFTLNPPGGLESPTFAPMLTRALAEGRRLQIAPPAAEGMDVAIAEGPPADALVIDHEPTEREVQMMAAGDGPAEPRSHEATYFAMVKDTSLATDEGRADFLLRYTEGATDSLAAFLEVATESEALTMVAAAALIASQERGQAERAETTALTERILRGRKPSELMQFPDDLPTKEPEQAPATSGDASEPPAGGYDASTIEGEFRESAETDEAARKPCTDAQWSMIERLASPKILKELSRERLDFDSAAMTIESLQPARK